MPELKRGVNLGKMNRTLDPRIVPSGEYLEALNVNVGRSESGAVGTIENLLGNTEVRTESIEPGSVCIGAVRDNANERIYFFTTSPTVDGVFEYRQLSNQIIPLIRDAKNLDTAWLNFSEDFPITGANFLEGLLFWTDNRNEPRKINVDRARNNNSYYDGGTRANVAKFAPLAAPLINGIGTTGTSTFLQNKLPRFSYRYRFDDGEFSVLAPFTPVCFRSNDTEVSQSDVNQGEIGKLINNITSVDLQVPIPSGYGITEVEVLYKETTNNTVYIIDDQVITDNGMDQNQTFVYASQDPFRAIPGDQITRVSDAVPRLAQSQEITGSRIVYGNYLANYNLPNLSFDVVAIDGSHSQFTNYSIKSRRTYQVGVVLADEFGRQSPVLLSSTGGDTVFVEPKTGINPTQKLQITFNSELPDWAHSYRVVVKQREQEYYTWFADSNGVTRSGDGINKVPIDQTQVGGIGSNNRPSSRSVFNKVTLGNTNVVDDNSSQQVSIIVSGFSGSVPDPNIGNAIVQDPHRVYEVEPVTSVIDIFFETSTGGIINADPLTGIPGNPTQEIEFYNCYLVQWETAAHLELNRIKAGFNEPFFDVGVRAHLVDEDFAGEERRGNGLIHSSGLFNSRTGLNALNQFNEAEGGITLQLDPSDGSVQKLYAEDTQLILFQEDKISRSPIDKDFIYSAEGGAIPVTSNTQYLGTIAPYPGEYGISRDPGSFAVYGENKFFTDRNRGVVMQLSQQGLVEISRAGMQDFFRDALRLATNIIGSYDEYHNQYNITINGIGFNGNDDTNIATAGQGYFTVSYEDDVSGWVSFKSFNQEQGLTLNNRYYTFGEEGLWEHNTNQERNSFYGETMESTIEVVFNDAPSAVKEFKTIGYEGSNGWECEIIETDLITIGERDALETYYTSNLQLTITLNNAQVFGDNSLLLGVDTTDAASPIRQPGEWNLVVVPDSNYQWSSTILPEITGGYTFAFNQGTGNAEVTIPNDLMDNIELTLTGTAVPEEEIQELDLTVANTVANATVDVQGSPSNEFLQDTPGPITFMLDPDTSYYFNDGDTTLDTSQIQDLISSVTYEFEQTAGGGDGQFTGVITTAKLPVLVPARTVTINGMTRIKDSYRTEISGIPEFWTGSTVPLARYRHDQFPIANSMITAEVVDNYLWLTDPTLTLTGEGITTTELVVTDNNEATFEIIYPEYKGTDADVLEIMYTLTEPTEITEITSTLNDFAVGGETMLFVNDSNSPMVTIESSETWLTVASNGDDFDITAADYSTPVPTEDRTAMLTIAYQGRSETQVIEVTQLFA